MPAIITRKQAELLAASQGVDFAGLIRRARAQNKGWTGLLFMCFEGTKVGLTIWSLKGNLLTIPQWVIWGYCQRLPNGLEEDVQKTLDRLEKLEGATVQ